jgi:hypothetical protein
MEYENIREQAERARRLAREVTDRHMRLSLEALADEYEEQLRLHRSRTGNEDDEDDDTPRGFTLRTRH